MSRADHFFSSPLNPSWSALPSSFPWFNSHSQPLCWSLCFSPWSLLSVFNPGTRVILLKLSQILHSAQSLPVTVSFRVKTRVLALPYKVLYSVSLSPFNSVLHFPSWDPALLSGPESTTFVVSSEPLNVLFCLAGCSYLRYPFRRIASSPLLVLYSKWTLPWFPN